LCRYAEANSNPLNAPALASVNAIAQTAADGTADASTEPPAAADAADAAAAAADAAAAAADAAAAEFDAAVAAAAVTDMLAYAVIPTDARDPRVVGLYKLESSCDP
jgi:hypothetical protein